MIVELFWASFGALTAFVVGGLLFLFPDDLNDVFDEDEEK